MQTFLPYKDFKKSAEILDKKRCWSQAREAKQILNVLQGKTKGYKNHPAVLMWKGFEKELQHYYNIFLYQCLNVHKINTEMWYEDCYYSYGVKSECHGNYFVDNQIPSWERNKPFWLGQEPFHRAMRARLIEKDPEFYESKFLDRDKGYNGGKYWWPVMEDKTFRII